MSQVGLAEMLVALKDEVRKRYKAELKGLFGSHARGEARADSDIDILVDFREGATLLDLVGLGDFLEEKLRKKVDVVSQRGVREEIRESLFRDMIYL